MDGIIDIPLPGRPLDSNLDPCGGLNPAGNRDSRAALRYFLAGPENHLVEVAVRAVLDDNPAEGYDPIVFYGPTGTGKSHLARGLAVVFKARYRRRRVVYTTAVDFARELKDALETNATDDLRLRYRKARLLIFEDLGQLLTKRAAQEELLHTLDVLLAEGRRVVVTAPTSPTEMPELLPGLRSRLSSGLTVPLYLPGPATRLAILRHLAELHQIPLIDPVARILADGLNVTVRELAGALIQLQMPARLEGRSIDAEAARSYLAKRNRAGQPELGEIAAATARCFSLKLSDLRGASRRRPIVLARGVGMYLGRLLTAQSLEQIGHYFGGRDHTTVMHACRNTERLLKTDPAVSEAVQKLRHRWLTG